MITAEMRNFDKFSDRIKKYTFWKLRLFILKHFYGTIFEEKQLENDSRARHDGGGSFPNE